MQNASLCWLLVACTQSFSPTRTSSRPPVSHALPPDIAWWCGLAGACYLSSYAVEGYESHAFWWKASREVASAKASLAIAALRGLGTTDLGTTDDETITGALLGTKEVDGTDAIEAAAGDRVALWNSGVWPFAQRAWIALLETGVEFEHQIIDLKAKPADFVEKYKRAGGSGAALVPLLEHNEVFVIESAVVARYGAKYIDGGQKMYPRTQEDLARVEAFLEKWRDVETTYYDLLRAGSEPQAEERRAVFVERLASIDALLASRSPFLLGDDFSYAECVAAPWVQRFSVTLPYFRGIDFEGDVLGTFDALPRWMRAVRDRESCKASLCPEAGMLAAARRYYVSYLSPGATGRL